MYVVRFLFFGSCLLLLLLSPFVVFVVFHRHRHLHLRRRRCRRRRCRRRRYRHRRHLSRLLFFVVSSLFCLPIQL